MTEAVAGRAASGPARTATPACAWCGGPTRVVGRRLVACARCGAGRTWPVPEPPELDAAYGGFYRPASGRFSGPGDRLLRASRGALARRVDALAPPGPVLDVGAGDGALLDALAAVGREALGLERDVAGDRADMVAAELTDYHDRAGAWSAVVLWHSLEHLADPVAALDHACGLLAPGGLVIVAVPNRASWQARALGDRWLALDLPRHLSHLTPRALLGGLAADGMNVERLSYWRGGQVLFGWLHGLVISLPGHPDLYDAIRRPAARAVPITPRRRALTLAAAAALSPLAGLLSVAEVTARAGGTVYVQARRAEMPGAESIT